MAELIQLGGTGKLYPEREVPTDGPMFDGFGRRIATHAPIAVPIVLDLARRVRQPRS